MVEDNIGDVILIKEHLLHVSAFSSNVHHAHSVVTALDYLNNPNHAIDVVLLDLSLPDGRGEHLITKFVQAAPNIPLIVLTGYGDQEFGIHTLSMGAEDYLMKDELSPSILEKTISYSVERSKIKYQLKASEIKYQGLFNMSPLPMWTYNLKTLKILDVNNAAIAHYGYSREEFLSMTIEDLRPRSELGKLYKAIDQAKNGASQSQAFKHKKKNGELIDVLIKGSSFDQGGADTRIVLSIDVTDQIKREMALEQSEKRFKSLVQEGSDMITVLNQQGEYLYVSPTSKTILGLDPEYMVGNSAYHFIHREDQQKAKEAFTKLKHQSRVTFPPYRFKNGKGEWRWIKTTMTNLLNDPTVEGLVANSQDITEEVAHKEQLRISNERFELASKASNEAIWEWNLETDEISRGDGYQKAYGYVDDIKITSTQLRERIHLNDRLRVLKSLQSHIESNSESLWAEEYRYFKKDGSIAFVEDRAFVIRNGQNKAIKMIGSMKDVTHNRRIQERILENAIAAEEHERDRIAKELHDGIVQQMTALGMFINNLPKLAENNQELVNQSNKLYDLATKITNETRSLSHNLSSADTRQLSLAELITRLINQLNSMGNIEFSADIRFEFSTAFDLKLKTNVYRSIQELCTNVLKHSQASACLLSAIITDNTLMVIIMDDGKGIDEQSIPQGIGIKNIKNRVYNLGGYFSMENQKSGGLKTTIEIFLS
ncbi:PAS domain S-box-containing protein [Marinoscillum furvescens DSM 4134]|uniref:histidine kinase n=1 Tax=Marinoscillum furvescens DSM 4134 TaxID=1122208 RepID=A0A3D9L936_MARFU|nr:PAS domain S-box-containing protein [Marinoscillum furvescens DSM 4134]